MPTVKRETDTERQCWFFSYDPNHRGLRLDEWRHSPRKTKRHVFRVMKVWSSIHLPPDVPRPAVPRDVAQEARRMFVESLTAEGDEQDMKGGAA